MSVVVYAGPDPDAMDKRIRFHNGFAWFLDSVFGGKELPHGFFGQGAGPSAEHPDPGALSKEDAEAFATKLDAIEDRDLTQRLWDALDGREASPSMRPALKTIRDIGDLARGGEGLAVR